ncbi:MAG TPA: polysaccharide deacetylase family protein [Candidatus Limnocylindrales bacterium]|nr:polysaccharide deacetylase family protein [Candidatus Limnocylindrales bacterium]
MRFHFASKRVSFLLCGLLFCLPGLRATDTKLAQDCDQVVANYRKIIVLMDDSKKLDPAVREQVATAGRMLFEQNHQVLHALEEGLGDSLAAGKTDFAAEFLDRVEKSGGYRDADKLVFRDTLEELAAGGKGGPEFQKRVQDDLASLAAIQALYQKEIGDIFAGLQTRGMPVHREAWGQYIDFLKQKYTREQILREMEKVLPPASSRGGGKKKSTTDEVFGNDLPPKTLVLTFDDGPHPRYTPQVLDILVKYGIKAVFFQVGRNLGPETTESGAKLAPTAAISDRILQQGSALGNHSYSHPVLPKLDEAGYTKEIDTTSFLIKTIQKQDPVLFRPPYGAINAAILTKVRSEKMKAILWNVDSEDWADPVPNSVAQRVVTEAEKQGRGIILFHDIHKVGLEALPQVIEALQKDGFRFAYWNGSDFAVEGTRGLEGAQETPKAVPIYRESWAAIIGIDAYQAWPKLSYATNDAQAVRDLLIKKYNFKPDHVFGLFDKDATRENILSLLGDKLGNPEMVKREDRVFVFYAGHGATRHLASGRDLGYIIPVDADLSHYEGSAISMSNFQDIAESIPAKHLFFVMDSCYSGLALTRGGPSAAGLQNYLLEISRRTARQMFTAGGADQQVADTGPNGHSVFTWTLLQALDGRADLNGDGVVTATELAAYVTPAVSALSHQTPAFGNLPGSEGGDFLFELNHETEFLNETSAQLGEDAIKLNSELEKLRDEIQKQAAQNEELKKQLAAAEAQLRQEKQAAQAGTTKLTSATPTSDAVAKNLPAATNDEGMRLYKEKKYSEAKEKFKEAARLQPDKALFANNAGFAAFKLEQYEEAVQWFQKTITLDPNRGIAYINLGDAYLKLDKKAEAKQAYEKYLELQPNSKSAPGVLEKLKALEEKPNN